MDTKKIKQLVNKHYPVRASLGFPQHVKAKVVEAAKTLRAAGKSDATIGKAFGLSEHSISRWVKAAGEVKSSLVHASPAHDADLRLRALIRYEMEGVRIGAKSKEAALDRIFALVNGK